MRAGVTPYKSIGLLLLAVVLVSCGPSPSPTRIPSTPPVALAETPGQSTPPFTPPCTGCPTRPSTATPPTVAPITPYIGTSVLAPYRKEPVNVQPAVVHEPIAPDLGNVVSAFLLSPQQRERLAQQGFVVSPAEYKEFYILYEEARYNYEPTFITSDSLLHLYHLLFDKVLRTLERERFIPALERLNRLMLEHAQQQYEQLRGTPLEESARRNVAYFAVGSRLLDRKAKIPAYAADLAEAELALIEGHSGIKRSPIFPALPYGEDYTQYIPRGHYTRGEDLKAYFRCMMEFSTITENEWTQNLYWSWLYLFFPLLEEPGEGYPAFMQSPAWLDKSLNTVLGSWAELRHDTILYAKQSYSAAEGGGKWPPTPELPKGYVEPVPEFYARLAALAKMTREGLQERGLLNSQDQESLQSLEDLSLALKRMAEKELAGQPLDEGEYVRILGYGRELENLTYAASDAFAEAEGYPVGGEEIQAAVIADVHTDPDPYGDNTLRAVVLEEGVGRIFTIYVVVPIEGELVVTKGGVFSYYEFPWPAGDRLTDEKWREMLDRGQTPALPAWTASFRVEETEEAALRAAVWQFNEQRVAAAFMPDPTLLDTVATGEALTENRTYIQTLVEQELYEGYHLVRLNYLSFDLQDAGRAIVTTRETWWDERYAVGAESWSGTLVARRPEYTIGVIYRLVRSEQGWLVSQVLLQGERPAWQAVTP